MQGKLWSRIVWMIKGEMLARKLRTFSCCAGQMKQFWDQMGQFLISLV